MSKGRMYSSYDLDVFQRCPKLWDLSHRWVTDEFGIAVDVGAAISVGLAQLRRGKPEKEAQQEAIKVLTRRFEERGGSDEWTLEGLSKHVLTGLELGMAKDLGLRTIISADEQTYGGFRPDVVGRTTEGDLRVVDDKVKLSLDSRYIDEELNRYKHSNQFFGYAWAVGQHYNESVRSVCVNLIILSPKPIAMLYPVVMNQKVLKFWAEGAMQDYAEMEAIEAGTVEARPRWESCASKYNKKGTTEKELCRMYTLCHELAGREEHAAEFYQKKERR